MRSLRSRWSTAPRPLRIWALHLSARWHQRNFGGFFEIRALPDHSCSSRHPCWRLLQLLWSTGNPLPVVEYVEPAPAVTCALAAPIVEYVTPVRAVACAAPVTTMTAAPTVCPTARDSCCMCCEEEYRATCCESWTTTDTDFDVVSYV